MIKTQKQLNYKIYYVYCIYIHLVYLSITYNNKQSFKVIWVNETSNMTSAFVLSLASIVKLYLMLATKLDIHVILK